MFRILKLLRFIRLQQLPRDKMYSTQCSLELGNQRYIEVDTVMDKNEDLHYHIGGNIRSDNPCVDIRKYWKPENEMDLVPTKKGYVFGQLNM